jgi:hypothetical protein
MTPPHDPYASRALLGVLVRKSAAAAVYDDVTIPDLKRLNDIAAGEAFVNALTNIGCMITRIPTEGRDHDSHL